MLEISHRDQQEKILEVNLYLPHLFQFSIFARGFIKLAFIPWSLDKLIFSRD